ncbi:MAG TPA: hypothetical protein VIQ02_10145 [Jiangellaceae bacterium]
MFRPSGSPDGWVRQAHRGELHGAAPALADGWRRPGESGFDGYQAGHSPGAVFADLRTRFSDPAVPKPFAVPDI